MFSFKSAMVTLATLSLGMASLAWSQVYKTVDEDGNVVFTDQPPATGAEPMDLPGLSVVEVPEYSRRVPNGANTVSGEPSIRDLRREYRDFQITSPTQDQTFVGTSNIATLAWNASTPLQEGMVVEFFVNDQSIGRSTETVVATEPLDRGEHTARVDLKDRNNRTIASSTTVTFFVRQNSVNFGGGGG